MPVINQDLLITLRTENKDAGLKDLSKGLRESREEFVQLSRAFGENSQQAQNAATKVNYFSTELNKSKASLKDVSAQSKMSSAQFLEMGENITVVCAGLFAAGKAIKGVISDFYDLAKTATLTESMRSNFKGTADDLELLKKATGFSVLEKDLFSLSNRAEDLGVHMKEQPLFMLLATKSMEKYGGSIEEAFQRVVYATDGQVKGLKSVGIQKEVYNQIVTDLVKKVGGEIQVSKDENNEQQITIKNLDAATQKRIRILAILQASGITMKDVINHQQTENEKLVAFNVKIEEAKERVGLFASKIITSLIPATDEAGKSSQNLTYDILAMGGSMSSLLPAIAGLKIAFPSLFSGIVSGATTAATSIIGIATALGAVVTAGAYLTNKTGIPTMPSGTSTGGFVISDIFTSDFYINKVADYFSNKVIEEDKKKKENEIKDFGPEEDPTQKQFRLMMQEITDNAEIVKPPKEKGNTKKENVDLKKQESDILTEILNKEKENLDLLDLQRDHNADIVTKRKELLQSQLEELKNNYATLQFTSDKVKNLDAQKKLQQEIEKSISNQVKSTEQLSKASDKKYYTPIDKTTPIASVNIKTIKADEVTTKTLKAEKTETKEDKPKGGDANSKGDRAGRANQGDNATSSKVQNFSFETLRGKTEDVMTSIGSGLSDIQRAFHMENNTTMSALIDNVNQFLGVIQVIKSVIDSMKAIDTFMSFLGTIGLADGGYVSGAGTSTSDSIPARLSNGEYVVNAESTSRYLPLLKAINNKSNSYSDVGRYAMGGAVRSNNQNVQLEVADVKIKGSDLYLSWRRQDRTETRRKG